MKESQRRQTEASTRFDASMDCLDPDQSTQSWSDDDDDLSLVSSISSASSPSSHHSDTGMISVDDNPTQDSSDDEADMRYCHNLAAVCNRIKYL
jgi:hypothetical protein